MSWSRKRHGGDGDIPPLILLGTLTGGVLIGLPGNGDVMVSVTVIALACLGWL
jgi:hypothetical protein